MQSLHSRGVQEPSAVIQHCLVHLRHPDRFDTQLLKYLHVASPRPQSPQEPPQPEPAQPSGRDTDSDARGSSPFLKVQETGPLAQWASVLDVGARRVLPGHLLRRSRVLASFQPTPAQFQQRVAITACTGEEAVFNWCLNYQLSVNDEPQWVVTSVQRDASSDDPLPTTPHPKASPEAVTLAQLAALKRSDVFEAASFNMLCAMDGLLGNGTNIADGNLKMDIKMGSEGGRSGELSSSSQPTFALGASYERMKQLLDSPTYNCLLEHEDAYLGDAALPTQRSHVQVVVVRGGDGGEQLFLWLLGMQANGCWMVTGIKPLSDSA